jgi:hypothetical protein
MEQQDLQDSNLPLASHQELRMFKLAKRNIISTPNVPGQTTTEIPMGALYEAIQNPKLHAMTYRILPQQAYQFCDFVKKEFIQTHLAKAKMQYENSTATQSIMNMTADGKIPQKVTLKLKTVTLGTGVMQSVEADRLNQELESIATTASKESLAALQRSRGRLDQTLQSFDTRGEIHDQASMGFETLCGGRGSINFLDSKWHVLGDNDVAYHLSDTLYSIAVYDGLTEAEKRQSELQAEANAKKLQKEEEAKKRSAADAIMLNADAAQDEKTMFEKFKELLQTENKGLRAKIAQLEKKIDSKNRGGGQVARGGHQQYTAPQTQSRGRGRGRGHQAPQDFQGPTTPRGQGHRGGRGRGGGTSQSRPPSRPASRSSSRPTSRSASPSDSTRRRQQSSSGQAMHRPWFAPASRIIVQTRQPTSSSETRGEGRGRGQHHPQQGPTTHYRGQGNRGRSRGRGRGQPRGRSRSRSNSSEDARSRRSKSRGGGSPKDKGNDNESPARRGRGRGRGARGGRQSPRQARQ